MTDFHTFKLEKWFDAHDLDKNGSFEQNDLLLLAAKVIVNMKEKGIEVTPKMEKKLMKANKKCYNMLTFFGTTCKTKKAFVKHAKRVTRLPGYMFIAKMVMRPIFKSADINGDGTLDWTEFWCLWSVYDLTDDEIRDTFAIIDANGDGAVSLDELALASASFFKDKEKSKYSAMFGSIDAFEKGK